MKICLIWPKSTFLTDPMVYPPLGLWYIRTALEDRGCEITYIDTSKDAYKAIPESDYYFVSGTSPQLMEIKKILAWLRKNRSGITVLGGAHALTQEKDSLLNLGFDIVYKGEINNSKDISCILDESRKSFIYKPFPSNLEDMVLPSRKVAHEYKAFLFDKDGKAYKATTMFTSRGCPQKCAFCESGAGRMWGRKIRWNPLGIVSKELKECYELGFRGIIFYDDILPLNKTRMLKILEVLGDYHKNGGMIWRCFLRSDMLIRQGGFQYLKAMRDTGLVEVLVGVESGSNKIKENIQKGTTIEQDAKVLKWCNRLGIKFKASFVLGLPGETLETMDATRKFIFRHRPDKVDVNTYIPFPGTPLSSDMSMNGGKYDIHIDTSNVDMGEGDVNMPETFWYKGPRGESVCLVATSSLTSDEIHNYRSKLIKDVISANIPY